MSRHAFLEETKRTRKGPVAPDFPGIATPLPHHVVQRAKLSPQSLAPRDVPQLQSTIGNRAVSGLLRGTPLPTPIRRSAAPTIQRTGDETVQRKGKWYDRFRRKPKPQKGKPEINTPPTPLKAKIADSSAEMAEDATSAKADNKDGASDKYRLTLAVNRMNPKFLQESTRYFFRKTFNKLRPKRFRRSKEEMKDLAPHDTGHAWIEMTRFQAGDITDYRSYGFYPGGRVVSPDSFATILPDSSPDNLYQDFILSDTQYNDAVTKAENMKEQASKGGIKYNLYGMNCTAFAREIVRAAGQKFPGMRFSPGAKIGPGSAFTPNRLYNALKRRQKRGKAFDYRTMEARFAREEEQLRAFQTIEEVRETGDRILIKHDLPVYDGSEIEQDMLGDGDAIQIIYPLSANGWREIHAGLSYWVKQDELEHALGVTVGPGEYHKMTELIGESSTTTTAPTTTTSDDSSSSDPTEDLFSEMLRAYEEDEDSED